jgi:hypothetical protein
VNLLSVFAAQHGEDILVDVTRFVSLGLGVLSFILSGTTYYFFMLRNPPAALAEHVRKVTSAYLAFVGVAMADTVTRLGEPFRWQLVGYLVVFALSANAQTPLLWYEKKALLKEQLAKRPGHLVVPERHNGPGVWGPPDDDSQEAP